VLLENIVHLEAHLQHLVQMDIIKTLQDKEHAESAQLAIFVLQERLPFLLPHVLLVNTAQPNLQQKLIVQLELIIQIQKEEL